MRKPTRLVRLSEDEYLRMEEHSRQRHEYVDGYVFAMTGSSRAHNLIAGNIFAFLHARLDGTPCRASISDIKLKLDFARSFYYPDVMVDCEQFAAKDVAVTKPVLIVEVLSPGTAGVDRREKLIAYQRIPSLKEYLIVYQDRQQAELYSKDADGQWNYIELKHGDELVLESLPCGPVSLPFATIYKGYNPPTRVKEEEADYTLN